MQWHKSKMLEMLACLGKDGPTSSQEVRRLESGENLVKAYDYELLFGWI